MSRKLTPLQQHVRSFERLIGPVIDKFARLVDKLTKTMTNPKPDMAAYAVKADVLLFDLSIALSDIEADVSGFVMARRAQRRPSYIGFHFRAATIPQLKNLIGQFSDLLAGRRIRPTDEDQLSNRIAEIGCEKWPEYRITGKYTEKQVAEWEEKWDQLEREERSREHFLVKCVM